MNPNGTEGVGWRRVAYEKQVDESKVFGIHRERKTKTEDVPPRLIGFLLILWRDPLRRNLRTIFGNVKQGTLLPCLKKERNGKETSASVEPFFTMRHIHVYTVYGYKNGYEYEYGYGYGY